MTVRNGLVLIGIMLLGWVSVQAQPGPIKNLRYEDDFRYLHADSIEARGTDKLKYLPLGSNASISFGGEIREWYEIRQNPNFGDLPPGAIEDPSGTLLHRLMLHADMKWRERYRLFVQLNNTLEIGNPNEPIPEISEDLLGIHQLFFEMKLGQANVLRLGRQEYNFGNELVISSREGPNNRQPFDGATFVLNKKNRSIYVLAATPVIIKTGVFDNEHVNEGIWGVYSYLRKDKPSHLDFYYLGFYSDRRSYNFTPGDQHRHTLGARLWNHGLGWWYDLETMYQTGQFEDQLINAFNFTGEVRYVFQNVFWKPMMGLGVSYITGDFDSRDDQLNTYDPMYPKPVYGLATPQGPSNIAHLKPTIGIQPINRLVFNFSWYWLARPSTSDGTYSPGMDQVRPIPPLASDSHKVGDQYSLDIFYIVNKNLSFITFLSYVQPGRYIIDTGNGQDTFFWASSLQYKF